MTRNSHGGKVLLLSVLVAAVPASAQNVLFMKDAPYAHFTAEDHAIFNETLNDTLGHGAEGETRKWSNPKTRASGEMTPLKSFERDGRSCRTLSIKNKAKGLTGSAKYNFCKQDSGKWALAN